MQILLGQDIDDCRNFAVGEAKAAARLGLLIEVAPFDLCGDNDSILVRALRLFGWRFDRRRGGQRMKGRGLQLKREGGTLGWTG